MKHTAALAAFITSIGVMHGAAVQPDALTLLREALGGETALGAVRTVRVHSTISRKPHKDHVEVAVAFPDRFFRTVRYFSVSESSGGSATHVDIHSDLGVDPGTWGAHIVPNRKGGAPGLLMSGFSGPTPLPESSRYELERRPELLPQRLADAHARFAEFVLPLFGNTSAAYPVEATSEANTITFRAPADRSWLLTLDPVTHLPSRMTWTAPVPPSAPKGARPSEWQTDFSDFRLVNGLRWPHRIIKSRHGRVDEDSTIERYEVNLKISDKTFRK
jgi:hypothetical protein